MNYTSLIAGGGSPVGTPPGGRNIGKAPPVAPPQAHIEPAPYDAAKDPTWKQWLSHGGEEFRNMVNSLDDGARQMLHSVLTSVQGANPFAQAANALKLPGGAPPAPTAPQGTPFPGGGFPGTPPQ
jgi:hypothetical protein